MVGLFLVVLCGACEPLLSARGPGGGDGSLAGEGLLVISPAEIDFGAVSVAADGPGVRSFTVTNAGGSRLTVHGHDEVIDLTEGASEVFTVDAEPYFELEPGEARRLEVTFTAPTEGSWAGQLRVNYGVETVELSGSGRAPVSIS